MGSRMCMGLFYWGNRMTDVAAIGIAVETDDIQKGMKGLGA